MGQMTKIFNYPQEVEQVSTKVKRETSMSSLNTPEATSSIPYSQCQYTSLVHSLNNNIIDSNTSANKKWGNQLVQGLKEITRSKSTYDFGTEFSADSTWSLQRLTDSVAGIHEGNISLLSMHYN